MAVHSQSNLGQAPCNHLSCLLSLSYTPPKNLTSILLSSLSLNYSLNLTGFPFLMRQSYACSLLFLPGPLQRTSGKCLPFPLNSEDRLLCSSYCVLISLLPMTQTWTQSLTRSLWSHSLFLLSLHLPRLPAHD